MTHEWVFVPDGSALYAFSWWLLLMLQEVRLVSAHNKKCLAVVESREAFGTSCFQCIEQGQKCKRLYVKGGILHGYLCGCVVSCRQTEPHTHAAIRQGNALQLLAIPRHLENRRGMAVTDVARKISMHSNRQWMA